MSRFVHGADRQQQTLLPECLDDYVAEDNPVRVVDVFVDELDLKGLDGARGDGPTSGAVSLTLNLLHFDGCKPLVE